MLPTNGEDDVLRGRRVLIVDDRPGTVKYLMDELIRRTGNAELVKQVSSAAEALKELGIASGESRPAEVARDEEPGARRYDVILVDLRMRPVDGFALATLIRERDDYSAVIAITAEVEYKQPKFLVDFRACGGDGFIYKDMRRDVALCGVRDTEMIASVWQRKLNEKRMDLDSFLRDWYDRGDVIAKDPVMVEVLQRAGRLAASDAPVLLLGETGVGKDVIANAIHKRSSRAKGPFVAVSLPAIEGDVPNVLFGVGKGAFTGVDGSPGLLEAADGGTIFLDEIGDMPLRDQPILLRVLEGMRVRRKGETSERAVDVRVVAATLQDLEQKVSEGTFREDLYYRLSRLQLEIPPLRERRADIVPLAEAFLKEANPMLRFAQGCADVLVNYRWPGNVRQLGDYVRAAALTADVEVGVTAWDMPWSRRSSSAEDGLPLPVVEPFDESVAGNLENALIVADGNPAEAERLLGRGSDRVQGRWLRRKAASLSKRIEGFRGRFPNLARLLTHQAAL